MNEPTLVERITARAAEAAKAITAVAAPLITALVVDLLEIVGDEARNAIAVAVGGAGVYLTKNRPQG